MRLERPARQPERHSGGGGAAHLELHILHRIRPHHRAPHHRRELRPHQVVPREARLDILHHARPLDQRELWR